MTGVCVVKFDGHGANEICFVPETCLQSSKNVKIKINGDYLFVHKNDRQHRARGKLLFTGSLNDCEEYCRPDETLLIDDSSWFTDVSQIQDEVADASNKVSQPEKKKRKPPTAITKTTQKRLKISNDGKIAVDNNDENNQRESSHQVIGNKAAANKKLGKSRIEENSNERSSNLDQEPLVFADLTNVSLTGNNSSPVGVSGLNQSSANTDGTIIPEPPRTQAQSSSSITTTSLIFTPRRILPPAQSQTSTPITTNSVPSAAKDDEDILYDDESTLPRHVQIELTKNRKRILDLEEQLKESKKLMIPMPNPVEADYLRRVLAVVDMKLRLANTYAITFGEKLGLTDLQLLEASGNGKFSWKKIVVNLITACFKDVNLENENYTSLRQRNNDLIDNIAAYVKTIRPSENFTDTQFSACVSGKCHHLKSDNKRRLDRLAARDNNENTQGGFDDI